jgi:hypothetical protein
VEEAEEAEAEELEEAEEVGVEEAVFAVEINFSRLHLRTSRSSRKSIGNGLDIGARNSLSSTQLTSRSVAQFPVRNSVSGPQLGSQSAAQLPVPSSF